MKIERRQENEMYMRVREHRNGHATYIIEIVNFD